MGTRNVMSGQKRDKSQVGTEAGQESKSPNCPVEIRTMLEPLLIHNLIQFKRPTAKLVQVFTLIFVPNNFKFPYAVPFASGIFIGPFLDK